MALVSLILLVILSIRVIWLIRMSKKYPATEMQGVKIIHSDLKKTPFSFLNYLFWKESISLSSANGQLVLRHELTHIKQKHTYDKLACRLLGCILWPNPFYRLIGKELDMVHEFIADEQAVNGNDTDAFARMLLAAHDSTPHFGPEHRFFSSPIKRRLTMLQASSKTSFAIFRRIAVIPALAGILLLFSFNARTGTAGILRADTKIILVVDPGHGGMDRGAHYGSYVEKDIDLKIANRISELAAAHNVEVHLTRNDDSYPTLNQRVIFSNQLHPDYFMSVHVNDDTDNGAANYLANITYNQNYNGSMKLLGCVMKSLSEPLHVNFTDMRIKQPNLWVLKNNVAPAITLELGDIKNKQQMQLLTDDKKLDEICNAILNGVVVAHKE